MTDLQCAATIVLVPVEGLATEACGQSLAGRRWFGVYVDRAHAGDPDLLAAISGRLASSDDAIEFVETAAGPAGFRAVLESLADRHRGETVAWVARAAAIRAGLACEVAPDEPLVLSVDSDGWTLAPRSSAD